MAKELGAIFLTSADICELLHVHSNTVHRWRKSGKLDGVKVGRSYLYPATQVLSILGPEEAAQAEDILSRRAKGSMSANCE